MELFLGRGELRKALIFTLIMLVLPTCQAAHLKNGEKSPLQDDLVVATASVKRDEAAALRAGRDQRIREQRVAEIETRQPNMETEYTYRLDQLGRRGEMI
jgi:hypothetical protein